MIKKELNCNGFEYWADEQGDNGINYPCSEPINLYKYYALNEKNIDALKNNYFYFSHPNQFNDIMDCKPHLWDFTNMDFDFFCERYQSIITSEILKEKCFKDYSNLLEQIYKLRNPSSKLLELYKRKDFFTRFYIQKDIIDSTLQSYGILSLATSSNNNLMWPHYTQEKGFCIELNREKLLEELNKKEQQCFLLPINYLQRLQPIDYFKYLVPGKDIKYNSIPVLYGISVKDKSWEYENEWRIVLRKNTNLGHYPQPSDFGTEKTIDYEARKIPYSKECINSITLGPYFFNNQFVEDFKVINSSKTSLIYLYILRNKGEQENKELNLFKELLHELIINFSDKLKLSVHTVNDEINRKVIIIKSILWDDEDKTQISMTLGI